MPASPQSPDRERVSVAARRVHRTPRTIRRWIDTGLVAGYRIGPRLLFVDPAEIDAQVTRVAARKVAAR